MAEDGTNEWPKVMGSFDGKRLVKECLDLARVGAIATHSLKGSWSATVYFVYDDNFNIYFVLNRSTRHLQDVLQDNRVGFSAFTPHEKSNGANIGVQMSGIVIPVPQEEVEKIYEQRMKKITGNQAWMPEQFEVLRMEMQGVMFMKIKPDALYYVNSTLFGGDKKSVPLDMTK